VGKGGKKVGKSTPWGGGVTNQKKKPGETKKITVEGGGMDLRDGGGIFRRKKGVAKKGRFVANQGKEKRGLWGKRAVRARKVYK